MTVDKGKWLASETRIFDLRSACPRILDLCMAPGGFTTTAKTRLPGSLIDAITLPSQLGGYEVMVENICQHITYADITMYSKEMIWDGNIPARHPDFERFEICRPYIGNRYDIVICGGAVVENRRREPYRNVCERSRLTASQLVFAMNRLKPGGSMVLLLHHIEAWDTVCILHAFNKFSNIQLYKNPKHHALGSSFYLVAKDVNLDHDAARISLTYWKDLWRYLTFKEFENTPSPSSSLYGSEDAFIQKLMDEFGQQFWGLARPVWEIQAKALRQAPFTQHKFTC